MTIRIRCELELDGDLWHKAEALAKEAGFPPALILEAAFEQFMRLHGDISASSLADLVLADTLDIDTVAPDFLDLTGDETWTVFDRRLGRKKYVRFEG